MLIRTFQNFVHQLFVLCIFQTNSRVKSLLLLSYSTSYKNKYVNKQNKRKNINKQTLLEMAADFFPSIVFQFEDEQRKCF